MTQLRHRRPTFAAAQSDRRTPFHRAQIPAVIIDAIDAVLSLDDVFFTSRRVQQ
jgi:hypothetical protein